MKVLKPLDMQLSNYEVYQHLVDQQALYAATRRRAPGNLAILMREVNNFLQAPPQPLQNQDEKQWYTPDSMQTLLRRLRGPELSGELTQAEVLCILNLRPSSIAVLGAVVENIDERFDEEQQQKLVDIITEVLGSDEPPVVEEAEEGGEDEKVDPSDGKGR